MAAFMTFVSGKYVEFHIGTKPKDFFIRPNDWHDVISLQVDGDELFKACAILGRQPRVERVYTFVGDEAKTIVLNWR
jgi:hypothetical protein